MEPRIDHAILNRDFGEVRTVVVLGVGRGGTSLVAGCLRALGVCMGHNPHALKHEWSPLVYRADGELDLPASRHAIAQMDRAHETWGWKSPRDVFQLEQVLPLLRDPGFIFVTRDILEASLSGLRYQDVPLYIGLDDTASVYRAITWRLRLWPWPLLVISFAGALRHPELFVDLLCSFLNIKPEISAKDQAINFVRPGRNAYRPFNARPDDPPVLIPPRELRADSEILAADFSNRNATEYFQQFEAALMEAKKLAAGIGSRVSELEELGCELPERLCKLLSVLSEDNSGIARQAVLESISGEAAAADFRATLDSVLRRLATSAQDAKHQIEKRTADSGYDAVTRLHRITQVMIRVRYLLQKALVVTELASPGKVSSIRIMRTKESPRRRRAYFGDKYVRKCMTLFCSCSAIMRAKRSR